MIETSPVSVHPMLLSLKRKKESLSYCLVMQYSVVYVCLAMCVYPCAQQPDRGMSRLIQTLQLVESLFQPILAVKDKPQDTERFTLPLV